MWHEVGAGETADALAARYHVPLVDIEELNNLERGVALVAGRKVFVPGARPASARAGRRTPAHAAGVGDAATPATATTRQQPVVVGELVWPVPGGKVVAGYGVRGKRPHEGVDIAAAEGTAILAAADGLVIYAGSGVRGYGNLILVRHDDGVVTVYAHNRKNLVAEKTRVRQGQVIAEVGRTGNATGSHLHFEVRKGETPVDPTRLVHPN